MHLRRSRFSRHLFFAMACLAGFASSSPGWARLTSSAPLPLAGALEPPAQESVLRVDPADWIEAPPSATFDFPSGLTIELWLHLEEAGQPSEAFLVSERPAGELGFGLFWDASGRRFYFAEIERVGGGFAACCQSPEVPLGQWSHVAFTLAADGTGRIFVDGVEGAGGGGLGAPAVTTTATVRLGDFGGAARQVRVWSRALDLAELLVRATTAMNGNEPGLAAAWPLDDGAGPKARNVAVASAPLSFPRDYVRGEPVWVRTEIVDLPYFRTRSSSTALPYHMGAALDLDLDGDCDVVGHWPDTTGWVPQTPFAHRNTGGGTFVEDTAGLFSGAPPAIVGTARPWTVADLTGDGWDDVLVPDYGPDVLPFPGAQPLLLVRQADGRLADETAQRLPALTVLQHGWTTGDVDGDTDVDIVLVAFGDGSEPRLTSRLLLNDGSGHFTERPDWYSGTWPGVYLGGELFDADGDGDRDLFLGSTGGSPSTRDRDTLLLNDGAGHFAEAPATTLPKRYLGEGWVTYDQEAADLNGDGRPDIVASLSETPPDGGTVGERLQILLANEDGTFSDGSAGLPQDAWAPINGNVWIRDVNGDALPDISLNGWSPFRRALYLNVGNARFLEVSEVLPATHASLMPCDVDDDGDLDMVGFGYVRAEIVAQEAMRPLTPAGWPDYSFGAEPSHVRVVAGAVATTHTVTVRGAFAPPLDLDATSPDPRLAVTFGASEIVAEEAVAIQIAAAADLPVGSYTVTLEASSSAKARHAVLSVVVVPEAVFSDGFESGDLSAWSSAAPVR